MRFANGSISLLTVLALAGCGGEHGHGDHHSHADEEQAQEAAAVGKVWRWTGASGAETVEVPHPDHYTIELSADGRYTVRADCNTGSGSYTIHGDAMSIEPGPMTMAACGAASLDGRFVRMLGAVAGYTVDADELSMRLGDDAGKLSFVAAKPVDLVGPSWKVRAYNNGKQAVVSVAQGTALSASFGADGRLAGSAGCNDYTASYLVHGDAIEIGAVAATRKMCAGPEGVMEQESAFLAALGTAKQVRGSDGRLQLRTVEGALAVDMHSGR